MDHKIYVPPLILEKKIVQLEESFEQKRINFQKEKQDLLSKHESVNSNQKESGSREEKQYFMTKINRLTSQPSALAADLMKEQHYKYELQAKLDILHGEKINLSESFSTLSDTSSCKAFLGDSLKNESSSSPPNPTSEKVTSDEEMEFSTFLNSQVCQDSKLDQLDFDQKLPSHVDFLDSTGAPSAKFYKGEFLHMSPKRNDFVDKRSVALIVEIMTLSIQGMLTVGMYNAKKALRHLNLTQSSLFVFLSSRKLLACVIFRLRKVQFAFLAYQAKYDSLHQCITQSYFASPSVHEKFCLRHKLLTQSSVCAFSCSRKE
ncbi:hypothetical protein L6452_18537 [Arctium lappa]|uniref:Uncharacterized protein n=1 Tax=Arctium lappa TaxID=4217 RepID=A0ACB9C6H3_ARCLA|nr:hypothetical protein L6452_18537 [Arctium lappa]